LLLLAKEDFRKVKRHVQDQELQRGKCLSQGKVELRLYSLCERADWRPPEVSKHGTLNEHDVQDVREVDIDQVLQHVHSASTAHIFGKPGSLPPDEAMAIERRYTRYWSIQGENGQDYVGLNKSNSAAKGRFQIKGLVEGEYKLVVRYVKSQNVIGLATAPLGMIIGGVSSLVAPADKREETYARGMPTEYVEVNMLVRTGAYVIMEQRAELDSGSDTFTRVFTIREADADAGTDFTLACSSYSLVKRMRIQADLFRCDLPRPRATSRAEFAAQGRKLINQAFSSGSNRDIRAPPPPPPVPQAQPRKAKRSVYIRADAPASQILVRFYSKYAPEKVPEVPKIIEHFLTRDKHLGILFATLEDKYSVRFDEKGEWRAV
jgi:hypothetical protein